MRLLEYKNDSKFVHTRDFGDNIPPYAILSHTWGPDTEEVSFRDLTDGTGKSKLGYDKLRFCEEQARRDKLQYFWVDTCCIDKTNSVELQEAINSMFRWYQRSVKCYVYLSDVSTLNPKASHEQCGCSWEPDFRESRWFRRGWTLQELLAPTSVEFFSREGKQIGDKRSLESLLHEISAIPLPALQGVPLAQYGVEERLSWAKNRQTTRKEDGAYALLGIFDVQMPLLYGEGRDKALERLREEVDKPIRGKHKFGFEF